MPERDEIAAILKKGTEYSVHDGIIYPEKGLKLSCELKCNQARFDKNAPKYEFGMKYFVMPVMMKTSQKKHDKTMQDLLSVCHNSKVLDVACGNGQLIPLIDKTNHYYGIDISTGLMRIAKSKLDSRKMKGALFLGDAQKMPFEDKTFDYVFSSLALHMLPDLSVAVQEIKRVMKPGGTFFASTPVSGYSEISDYLWRKASKKTGKFGAIISENDISAICTEKELKYKKFAQKGRVLFFSASVMP